MYVRMYAYITSNCNQDMIRGYFEKNVHNGLRVVTTSYSLIENLVVLSSYVEFTGVPSLLLNNLFFFLLFLPI